MLGKPDNEMLDFWRKSKSQRKEACPLPEPPQVGVTDYNIPFLIAISRNYMIRKGKVHEWGCHLGRNSKSEPSWWEKVRFMNQGPPWDETWIGHRTEPTAERDVYADTGYGALEMKERSSLLFIQFLREERSLRSLVAYTSTNTFMKCWKIWNRYMELHRNRTIECGK